ncbi:MAG: hypothetical protein WD993_02095 [Thermoleophilaceae bacterium]
MPSLNLIVDPDPVDPALDSDVSRALIRAVGAGELPDTVRISRPTASVAFGRRDVVSPGYAAAEAAARAAGFDPIERVGGGRAAVFHEDTLHLSWTVAEADPRSGVMRRFEEASSLIAGALRNLGVDAHVGAVEGEYCPGAHSINARHVVKLAGLGQRVVKDAAHVGAVIVVSGADRVRDVLGPVYDALELDWDPAVSGSLAGERPDVTWEQTAEAIEAAYAARQTLHAPA